MNFFTDRLWLDLLGSDGEVYEIVAIKYKAETFTQIWKREGCGATLVAESNAKHKLYECLFCHNPIDRTDFKDEVSMREFWISGLCAACQETIFKKG